MESPDWPSALLERLQTSPLGLSSESADLRLREFGPNEIHPARAAPAVLQFALLFANPLVIILLCASAVSAFLHEGTNAAIIITIVILSVVLDFAQTYRSQRAAERLRARVALTCTVLRDGAWQEVPRKDAVPGDLVRLSAGDLVPADARLLESRDLHVQQAALTGESLPAEKEAEAVAPDAPLNLEERSAVFLGSSVVSGTGTAAIVATGASTMLGGIAQRIARRPPETEFDRGMRQFSGMILQIVTLLVLVVLLASAVFHRDPLQSLLFAVALAVGLTPEFLPMIVSVTLARGAVRMARKQVIVKHLATMQNFGSMDVLCSDKTGTLTRGEMTLDRSVNPFGAPSDRALDLAVLNSAHESGIKSPLDAAILQRPIEDAQSYQKIDEIPFDFERRRVSVVLQKNDDRLLITKGAPESVIPLCSDMEIGGERRKLEDADRERCLAIFQELSAQGYRLLAVAFAATSAQPIYGTADEQNLVLTGFLAFVDPPRDDSASAVRALQRDGVHIKILTGDNELVTRHLCGLIGLDGSRMIVGRDLDHMSDDALANAAEQTLVFARMSPEQKNRVILALKGRGHVVGYLGDGINDAPSLHAADVGISVSTAVDVARDAADIILMERSLHVLHAGITEGRCAFGNVMKYLLMETSSNFGNIFSMAAASLMLPFLPMLPLQILLNNFLYDLSQLAIPADRVDSSFLRKPRHWEIGFIRRYMLLIGPISSLFDLVTFAVLLFVLRASEPLFQTGWFVESLSTQTLVLFVIRTAGNPLHSRPSRLLTASVLLVVAIGLLLPYAPFAATFGFVPLPAAYFLFLAVVTALYLISVELVKRRILR